MQALQRLAPAGNSASHARAIPSTQPEGVSGLIVKNIWSCSTSCFGLILYDYFATEMFKPRMPVLYQSEISDQVLMAYSKSFQIEL